MASPARLIVIAATVLAVFVGLSASASASVPAWTTYRHDAGRSGIDPDSLNPVTPSQAWQTPALDGEVYAQPLVYGPYVYVATENDTIYELSAATGAVIWATHLATPEPSSAAPCGDIDPSVGITSTPVIDPSTGRIYAVGAVSGSGGISHQLFALNLNTGQPAAGFPIDVDPPYPSGGGAVKQLQRPGLALDDGRILIGYGGNNGDCSTYWGWLVSAPESGAGAQSTFQVDPNYHAGAIWGGGNAPPVDDAGNVYVATGNGIGNSSSEPEYGDAVVKLNAFASVLDWWAPTNWHALDSGDLDLGSSMPTLLPGGYLFEAGKDGNGYVLNGSALGNVSAPAAEADGSCSGGGYGGAVYDPADASIYAACAGGIQALSFASGSPPSLRADAGFTATSDATGPPMIAAGLVWSTSYGSGTLYGLNPANGGTVYQFPIPENTIGGGSDVNHFASPSAGEGRLFVASGDQVTGFTVATAPSPTSTSTTLSSSANPAAIGRAVSLRAQVSPIPYGGTITFTNGGKPIPGCAGIAVSAVSGAAAACSYAFKTAGTHKLVAYYSGDQFDAASLSPVVAEKVGHPPGISGISISPRRFPRGHRATLRIKLSEMATVTVAITQLRRGHVQNDRCSTHARKGKRCSVRVTVLRLHFHARKGKNSFKLRLGRLRPGHYTALIYATDRAGVRSRTVRIRFTVLP